jgi:RNA polymerase sigma-70 factor (ECF subfamily)
MALPESKLTIRNSPLQVANGKASVKQLQSKAVKLQKTISRATQYAMEAAFAQHYEKLWRQALSSTRDEQSAKDIVKDVFMKAMEAGRPLDDKKRLKVYLFMAVKMACKDHLKQQRVRRKDIEEFEYLSPAQVEIEFELGMEAEYQRIVTEELAKLPPQRKKILEKLFIEGLSTQEVAARMQLSRQTVLNQKQFGLSALRDIFSKKFLPLR